MDKQEAALKYYELHTTHREQLFNFKLVTIGAIAVAYTTLLENHSKISGAVAGLGAVLVLVLTIMEYVSLDKIRNCKGVIACGDKDLKMVFEYEPAVFGFGDNWLKSIFSWIVIGSLCVAAYYAFKP